MKKLLIAVLFFAAPGLWANDIPVEAFSNHGDYLDLKLSPDGKHLAARVRNENTIVLLIMRASDNKIIGGVKPGSDDVIHSVTWVNKERVVYEFAEKRVGLDSPVGTGELFGINIDRTKNKQIYGYRAYDGRANSRIKNKDNSYASQEILSLLEDQEKYILIIEYPWQLKANTYYDNRVRPAIISRLNVYTGKKKKIETLPYPRVRAVADKHGNINFISWRDDKNKLFTAFRKDEDDDWQELSNAFEVNQELSPFTLSKDLSKVYMWGRESEKGLSIVYEMDIATGHYQPMFEGLATDIENVLLDHATDVPVVAVSYPDKPKYHYAKVKSKTKNLHRMLAASFEGQDVFISSSSQDGDLHLVHVSSDINPGEYYTFNSKTNKAAFLWANRSWIDPRTQLPKQPIKITARDGVEINGYLTLPATIDAGTKPPLLVMLHGGPHGPRDHWDYESEVQLFANKGYAVLQPNFRGSGGYGQDFLEMGHRQWGGSMINDILDATKWTVEQNLVDSERICTYGGSYGGYAALMSVVRAPDMFSCTVGIVGLYDLNNMFTDSDIATNYGGQAYLEDAIGRDPAELKEFSPVSHADKIKAKVLLIHGEKDERVSVKNTDQLETKLEKAGNPAEIMLFSQSGHGVYDQEDRLKMYKKILDFLGKHIGS